MLSHLLMQELELFIILIFLISAVVVKKNEACRNVQMVRRAEWRARAPTRESNMATPVNHVIISHTVSPQCFSQESCIQSVQAAQNLHMDVRVGGDGVIYEGRGWTHTGAHAINYNQISIGISFIGDYTRDTVLPKMIVAVTNLINCGVQRGYLTPSREIHGHRDVTCTLSPGKNLYKIIRQWKNYKGDWMPNYYCARPN